MDYLRQFFDTQKLLIVYGILGAATGFCVLMWAKHPFRWLLGIAVILLLAVLYQVPIPTENLDSRLPEHFRLFFKFWVFVLGVVTILTLAHLIGTVYRYYRGERPPEITDEGYPDIDSAWEEIQIRMSQARIDLTTQRLYLLIGPDEMTSSTIVEAADVQLFAEAPQTPDAPIHAYAVSDGVMLSLSGVSAFGPQGLNPTSLGRLKHLMKKIEELNEELPVLRGIAVLLPFEWATSSDALRQASALREDLQTIRSILRVQAPTLAIFCLRQSDSGFNEFAARMPENLRLSRCGFSVPRSIPFRGEVVSKGISWMSEWFLSWSLRLMVEDIQQKEGNSRLMRMNCEMRRNKLQLAHVLDSAFTMHTQSDPILFRGCYFAAISPEPESRAFVAGLLRSPRGRLLADHLLATWAKDAEKYDRRYRLAAWIMAGLTALFCLPVWYFGVIGHMERVGRTSWGWVGLICLAAIWPAVLLLPRTRRKAAV